MRPLKNLKSLVALCILFQCLLIAYSAKASIPQIWNLPLSHEEFVGRKEELTELNKLLSRNRYYVLAITGSGGIGKKRLVSRYVDLHKSNYDIVWHFASSQSMEKQLQEFAYQISKLKSPEIEKEDFLASDKELLLYNIKELLRKSNYRWMLIFGSFDNFADIEKYLPLSHNPSSRGHVIITSVNKFGWPATLKLEKLKREDSVKLLKSNINQEEGSLTILADQLDDYPLALVQAASYIKTTPDATIDNYVKLLSNSESLSQEKKKDKINPQRKDMAIYEQNLQSTLELSLDKIKDEDPSARELLIASAYLNNSQIPDFLLGSIKNNLQAKSELDQALSLLVKYSLLDSEKKSLYGISKVVQSVLKDLNKDKTAFYLEVCAKSLLEYLHVDINKAAEFLHHHSYLIKHAERLVQEADINKISSPVITDLKLRLAEYYLILAVDYETTEKLIENLKLIKSMDSLQQYYFNMICAVYEAWHHADYDWALELCKIAEKCLSEYPDYNYEKLWLYNQMAQFYNYSGNIKESKKHLAKGQEVIDTNPDISGKNLFGGLSSKTAFDNGEMELALKFYNQALKDNNINLEMNNEEPWMIESSLWLYRIKLKQNQVKEIYSDIKALALKLDKIFGKKDHTTKYFAYAILAECALNMNDITTAVHALGKSEEIMQHLCSNNAKEQEQAYFYIVKGNIMFAQEKYSEAFDAYAIAENIYNKIYTLKETDDVSDTLAKLALTAVKLKDQKLANHYLDLHREHFGTSHPRTAKVIEAMVNSGIEVDL